MTRTTKRAILAALCVAATVAHAAKGQWTVTDLGALGSSGSSAVAISNFGDVAGYSRARTKADSAETYHAFLWQGTAMYDLGFPAGTTFVQPYAMSENGVIVATADLGLAYVWKNGAWSALNFPGTPRAVNRNEQIVGSFQVGAATRAFLYSNGRAEELGTLGGSTSRANAINDGGTVVGNASIPGDTTSHAFVFQNGMMRDIGTLGGSYSSANDVNVHGVVVGGAYNAENRMQAFIYDANGMRPLLNLPGTHSAVSINDRGAIVGLIDDGAFLYDSGVFTRLDQLPEVRAAGWSALFPTGINERGWITGYGWHADGRPASAFVMVPPPAPKVWTR